MNGRQAVVAAVGLVVLLSFGAAAATVQTSVAGSGGGTDASGGGPIGPPEQTQTTVEGDDSIGLPGFPEGFFDQPGQGRGSATGSVEDRRDVGEDGSIVTSPQFPAVGLVVLVLAVVAASVLVYRRSAGADVDPEPDEGDGDETALSAVGEAAGRAADDIAADADPENAVYRAWLDMTGHLDVANPASTTPGEFARAAVEAGMDPDDVGELTDLFEAVRYGGYDPDEDRERRAVASLRRIEAAYADDASSTDGGSASDGDGGDDGGPETNDPGGGPGTDGPDGGDDA